MYSADPVVAVMEITAMTPTVCPVTVNVNDVVVVETLNVEIDKTTVGSELAIERISGADGARLSVTVPVVAVPT